MIFDHIGIFVPDLASGRSRMQQFLPIDRWSQPVDDPLLRVSLQFGYEASGIRYEIVAPFGPDDPVTPLLKTGHALLNHVAYRVSDLDAALIRLRQAGGLPVAPPKPALAFGGRRVAFMLTPLRFILELIEET